MKLFEKCLNAFIPKIESIRTTERVFTDDQFRSLVMKLYREYSYDSSEGNNEFILNISGNSFSNLIASDKTDHSELYKNTKSKLHFLHLPNGKIRLRSFEHFIGSKKERSLYKKTLEERIDRVLNQLEAISF